MSATVSTTAMPDDLKGTGATLIPTTIHGLVDTRTRLPTMLRVFRRYGPRGVFAFGRHHRAEAVILPWLLFERLADAAHALEDAARASELDRRRRHPSGPTPLTLQGAAVALGAELPRLGRPGPGAPTKGYTLLAWPTAIDDLMRLAEEQSTGVRDAVANALVDVAMGRRPGVALSSLPGQPQLAGYRRVVVPLGGESASAVIVAFGDPTTDPREPAVELLAVLTAGPLVSALQDLDTLIDLDTAEADGELEDQGDDRGER